ncbi:hypothetical protein TPHA_0I01130 [Tetrapisispora phaffii CBS 4417]|uniref:DNA replication complex GINS protein PSF2 n=1 Tax=Tetrapisispora phaffii (strain ATCC 24235 / CBS 4417 / NBRC 1672 / NRRL Y-8282 / UCD 70-5) TaxID=1071381 RepID=G8BXJ1_TETPH|nr:hypothetical protein TPHA_0I01130 [Tetrapisispora phaffii CBS 4417]CCE64619.1 hypothetical protein TPHA_0I01130 [Tetrapisispora phaffii CBS 4417]
MSLPPHLQETFSPDEIQFIVENENIKIFPRITTRQTVRNYRNLSGNGDTNKTRWKLITSDENNLNNMVAMQTTEVALWVALLLKQQNKCSIIAPSWLTVKELSNKIRYEESYHDRFSPMPWDWLVLSNILFKKAADDFNDPIHELRTKIQDLREIRQLKVMKGLEQLNESHLQLDNLSLMEINELRPFIADIMDKLREVHASANANETQSQSQDINMSI